MRRPKDVGIRPGQLYIWNFTGDRELILVIDEPSSNDMNHVFIASHWLIDRPQHALRIVPWNVNIWNAQDMTLISET